jgi:hypothetical protein
MPTVKVKSGTVNAMIRFLGTAARKGWMNQTTARSYASSTQQVLRAAYGDENFGDLKVRDLNVAAILNTFTAERAADYAPGSLASYETRFRRAVELYLQFLDNPDSFEQPLASRRRTWRLTGDPAGYVNNDRPDDDSIEYVFPLHDGRDAYLRLPRYLAPADVDRLTAFLKSIAIPPGGQPPLFPDVPTD